MVKVGQLRRMEGDYGVYLVKEKYPNNTYLLVFFDTSYTYRWSERSILEDELLGHNSLLLELF